MTLSVKEIAEILNLSTATVYTMVKKNKIPHKKLGRKIIFHYETIEKWLTNELQIGEAGK